LVTTAKSVPLPQVARYADEWNAVFLPPAEFARLNSRLDELLKAAGREPKSVRRSMMTGLRFGRARKELDAQLSTRNQIPEEQRRCGIVVGVGEEVKEQLSELENTGLQRLMPQRLELDDLRGLSALAKTVL
jgi:alkanesulfonate monooxygenase SsuD/methylene tetrahydromethanopterin reductase-like flavin-dependent oxidoreductase (luciferase family)